MDCSVHVCGGLKVAVLCGGYTSYTMLLFSMHGSLSHSMVLHSRMGLQLIDWICIKMKDNEVHQSTFIHGCSGQKIRGLFWLGR